MSASQGPYPVLLYSSAMRVVPLARTGAFAKCFWMPKNWNAAYVNDDTPWDKGYAAPPLRTFLSKHRVEGLVLVPGCGTGHDVRLLAGQGAVVVGLDIATGAVRKAERFPKSGDERYEVGDFLELAERFHGGFDWVVEHTCLCALDPGQRRRYAASVRRALKPGGFFLAVFYREVPDFDGEGPPYPISAETIEALFGEGFQRLESFVPEETYPSRPVGCEEVVLFRRR